MDPWVQVEAGKSSYFYNRETKEVSWTLPVEALNVYLSKVSNEVDAADGVSAENAEGAAERVEEEGSSAQVDDDALEDPTADTEWVVKIHHDSGQLYFYNNVSKDSSFRDPYATVSIRDLEEEDMKEIRKLEEAKIEKLIGEDLCPEHVSYDRNDVMEESDVAAENLQNWVERNKLEFPDEDSARLKFAEYVDCERDFSSLAEQDMSIRVVFAGRKTICRNRLTHRVQDVLNRAVESYRKGLASDHPDRDSDAVFVLKVVGFNDYLVHTSYQLGFYDYLVECRMKDVVPELALVRLKNTDLVVLSRIMEEGDMDALDREDAKCRPGGDEFDLDVVVHSQQDKVRRPWDQIEYIPIKQVDWPFRIIVRGVQKCPTEVPVDALQVTVQIYYNGEPLVGKMSSLMQVNSLETTTVPFSAEPRWPGKWLASHHLSVADIPVGARVAFTLYGMRQGLEPVVIAGVSVPLIDVHGRLIVGRQLLRLWASERVQCAKDESVSMKGDNQPRHLELSSSIPMDNPMGDAGALDVVFDSYQLPVLAEIPTLNRFVEQEEAANEGRPDAPVYQLPKPTPEEQRKLEDIEKKDPLHDLSQDEKHLVWTWREYCSNNPAMLPKFLRSVDWISKAEEARRMMLAWEKWPERADTVQILELLDIRYSDPVVREYAVREVDRMRDHDLEEYLLQLVQTLKYETFDDSPLARMLIRRSLGNPFRIGHKLFWMLRSEMHNPDISPRYGAILKTYVRNCGPHRKYLEDQVKVNDLLKEVAEQVKTKKRKRERQQFAREALHQLERSKQLPRVFQICLTPRVECCGINWNKCKVMDSKKLPLWVSFKNADERSEEPYLAIFKCGDDLRQDLMTLQILRIMDRVWKAQNLNLRLRPYGCASTGNNLGMIEVVTNSATTAGIQLKYGGKMGGAFKETPIHEFLKEHNDEQKMDTAVDNFVHSCAGYCVATYVMGIGDRHADNIMVTESGHLFHIDFGHFLGNFKTKMGIKRERAPFVFTPEMAYVMGTRTSERYRTFESYCFRAYNAVRSQGVMLINLFVLMVPAAMPELLAREDVVYMRDMLKMELGSKEAETLFKGEIKKSLGSVTRRVDNWVHNLRHG